MRAAILLTLFVAFGAGAREEPADDAAKDTAALKGKWEIVSSEFEGKDATAAYRGRTVIVIDGDKLYITDGFAKSNETSFKLDAKTKPRSIDIASAKEKENEKGKEMHGIYVLDKDSLKLCLSLEGERPKEFKTKAGDKTNLFVLKRQKP